MATGVLKSQALLICSKSELNYAAILLAKLLHKPVYYILHGYASYEARLNGKKIRRLERYDAFIVRHADRIICVSPYAMAFMKEQFPAQKERFDYIYNAVSVPKLYHEEERQENAILSVGANMRRKACLPLAMAVERLRRQGRDYQLILIGSKTDEYEKIRRFSCVDWREPMPHEELLRLMARCPVYVQNSTFDTFALAPVEALYEGASVILSDYVGCKTLFGTLKEEECIHDPQNIDEIARVIDRVMQNGNYQRLLEGLNVKHIGVAWMSQRFSEIFGESADV